MTRDPISLRGHTGAVNSVAFSPDSKMLASGSQDNTIKLWEVSTGKERTTIQSHGGVVFSVTFSPDGKLLAASSILLLFFSNPQQ
jgi:WD40 repeat protein